MSRPCEQRSNNIVIVPTVDFFQYAKKQKPDHNISKTTEVQDITPANRNTNDVPTVNFSQPETKQKLDHNIPKTSEAQDITPTNQNTNENTTIDAQSSDSNADTVDAKQDQTIQDSESGIIQTIEPSETSEVNTLPSAIKKDTKDVDTVCLENNSKHETKGSEPVDIKTAQQEVPGSQKTASQDIQAQTVEEMPLRKHASWASNFMQSIGAQQKIPIRLNSSATKTGNISSIISASTTRKPTVLSDNVNKEVSSANQTNSTITLVTENIKTLAQTKQALPIETVSFDQDQNNTTLLQPTTNHDAVSYRNNTTTLEHSDNFYIRNDIMPQTLPSCGYPNYPTSTGDLDPIGPQPLVPLHVYPNYAANFDIQHSVPQRPIPCIYQTSENYTIQSIETNIPQLAVPLNVCPNPNYCQNYYIGFDMDQPTAQPNPYPNYSDSPSRNKDESTEKRFTSTYKIPKLSTRSLPDPNTPPTHHVPATSTDRRKVADKNKKNTEFDSTIKFHENALKRRRESDGNTSLKAFCGSATKKNRTSENISQKSCDRIKLTDGKDKTHDNTVKSLTPKNLNRTSSVNSTPTYKKDKTKDRSQNKSEKHRENRNTTKNTIEKTERKKDFKENKHEKHSKQRSSTKYKSDCSCTSSETPKTVPPSDKLRSSTKHKTSDNFEIKKQSSTSLVSREKTKTSQKIHNTKTDKHKDRDEHKTTKEHQTRDPCVTVSKEKAVEELHKHIKSVVVQKIAQRKSLTDKDKSYKKELESVVTKQIPPHTSDDLRDKLSHKTLSQYFARLARDKNAEKKRKERDNLIITVPNETEKSHRNTEGESSKLSNNKRKMSIKSKKSKKIKLVINIQYEDDDKSSDDSDSSEDKNSEAVSDSPNIDLSFLDSLNIDEIVSCLSNCADETVDDIADNANKMVNCSTNCVEKRVDVTKDSSNIMVNCLGNRDENNATLDSSNKIVNCLGNSVEKREDAISNNLNNTVNCLGNSDEKRVEVISDNSEIKTECKDEFQEIQRFLTESSGNTIEHDNRSNLQETKFPSTETLILPLKHEMEPENVSDAMGVNESETLEMNQQDTMLITNETKQEYPTLRIKSLTEINSEIKLIQQSQEDNEHAKPCGTENLQRSETAEISNAIYNFDDLKKAQDTSKLTTILVQLESREQGRCVDIVNEYLEAVKQDFGTCKPESALQCDFNLLGNQQQEVLDLTDETEYESATITPVESNSAVVCTEIQKCYLMKPDIVDLTKSDNNFDSCPSSTFTKDETIDVEIINNDMDILEISAEDDDLLTSDSEVKETEPGEVTAPVIDIEEKKSDLVSSESKITETGEQNIPTSVIGDNKKIETKTCQIEVEIEIPVVDKVNNSTETQSENEMASNISVEKSEINKQEADENPLKESMETDSVAQDDEVWQDDVHLIKMYPEKDPTKTPKKDECIKQKVTEKPNKQNDEAKTTLATDKQIVSNSKNEDTESKPKSNKYERETDSSATINEGKKDKASKYWRIKFEDMLPDDKIMSKQLEERMIGFLKKEFVVTTFIRKGRFSKILQCKDSDNQNYVVKVITNENSRYRLGYLKEMMMAKIQEDIPEENRFLVHLINGFAFNNQWCFLMEYCSTNLVEVLRKTKTCFHMDKVQMLARQLVTAVTVLRNNHIVHADIKPSHILLNNTGDKLKLCGFDTAFYFDNRKTVPPNTTTPSYRAPEVIVGYPAGYGIDVWATGLCIYEMATNLKFILLTGVKTNQQILYKQLCALGNMPRDMIAESRYATKYFQNFKFMQRPLTNKQQPPNLIANFYKTDKLYKTVSNAYYRDWGSYKPKKQRLSDYRKLIMLVELLERMLVLHPDKRMPIEFVYSNSFFTLAK